MTQNGTPHRDLESSVVTAVIMGRSNHPMEVLTGDYCVTTGEERTITGRSCHAMEDDSFGVVVHASITNHDSGKMLCMTSKVLKEDMP